MYRKMYFEVFYIFVLVTLCPEVSCDYCVDYDNFVLTNTNEKTIQPAWFTDCQGGRYFNLSHNKIDKIKNTTFNILWNIEVLDISFNEISSIDAGAFFGMRKLQHLNMSNNQMSKLPDDFFGNKNFLIVVDLSYNMFAHIALTDLRYNNIRKWHDWYLQQYKDQNEQQTGVETIMMEILTYLRENPLVCDCHMHNLVTRIRQSAYKWSNIEYLKITCYDPPELRGNLTLYEVQNTAFVCNISQDCPSGCLCQDRPEDRVLNVDCRGLGLTRIPPIVPRSPYQNITLQLDNNRINTFENVSYISQITSISMTNNLLTSIPDFVMNEIASKDKPMVDFRNNFLTSLPSSLRTINYQNAYFQGNRLECSCEQLWMVNWINMSPAYVDKTLTCEFEGKRYTITELDESKL